MRIGSVPLRHRVVVSFVPALLCLAACGGGGGGAPVGDDHGLAVDDYDFALDLDGTGAAQLQLTAMVWGAERSVFLAGVSGNPLGSDFLGTLALVDQGGSVEIASVTVADTTVFLADVSELWPGTTLGIAVCAPIVFAGGDDPAAGCFTMTDGANPTVTVSFSKVGSDYLVSVSGVQDPVPLDELKGWLETSSDTASQQLSVAYHTIELLHDQVLFVAGALVRIENDEFGSVPGDANPGLPVDPSGGTFALTCSSGTVQPGADFAVVFADYWIDDPADDIDTLIDGAVDLRGFLKNETADVLQNIGFAWSEGAGVFFGDDGLSFFETEGAGTLTATWTHTVRGSYAIVFTPQ